MYTYIIKPIVLKASIMEALQLCSFLYRVMELVSVPKKKKPRGFHFALYIENQLRTRNWDQMTPTDWSTVTIRALSCYTPGKRSTCTPPAYYRRVSWPVPVDYLTCVNEPKIRTGIWGHFVQCEFIFLFYFLQKNGECHMLWQWIYVIQTPV